MGSLRRRTTAVMVREVGDEVLLLDTESDRIHQLNRTASFIWRKCDESGSAEEIAASLSEQFDVDEHTAVQDVTDTLSKLLALKLIVEAT